jgi:predicted DNA-binding transcriptional regulator AlpA
MEQCVENLLDSRQVARILRCSAPLVYKMADRKQLPCIRWECPGTGSQRTRTTVRFRLEDIQEFIEKHHQRR